MSLLGVFNQTLSIYPKLKCCCTTSNKIQKRTYPKFIEIFTMFQFDIKTNVNYNFLASFFVAKTQNSILNLSLGGKSQQWQGRFFFWCFKKKVGGTIYDFLLETLGNKVGTNFIIEHTQVVLFNFWFKAGSELRKYSRFSRGVTARLGGLVPILWQ